ncbi:DUF1302 family protein [Spirochaeta thermophila]|uniref:Porin domain-containing protein n=1 Tax=Winmispira thermophila (strain ATCC 49972 / DSM 6192 / RI 19.B1) TaxID=665571 RepID=E0RT66_WINT6|nr:DUF1302 family protein [Spirochaeta thermophila]ADN02362.1 hypothetical protein STHERM_c14220 [Spirochaeta thermophila DSM 6192]
MKRIGIIAMFSVCLLWAGAQELSFFEEGAAGPVEVSGKVESQVRLFTDPDREPGDQTVSPFATVELGLAYEGERSRAVARLHYSQWYDYTTQEGVYRSLEDLIDEAYVQVFLPWATLDVGYLKLVWGKGDKVHVFDTINPMDYSDFINPDYLERKKAEKMVRLGVPVGTMGSWELVYVPVFTPDVFPTEGMWVQRELAELENAVEEVIDQAATQMAQALATQYITGSMNATAAQDLASLMAAAWAEEAASSAVRYELPDSLEDFVAATRFTYSAGGVDLGLSYQYTFDRLPVIDTSRLATDYRVTISYDRVHLFGLEAGAAPGGFNLKGELAYFLTEDTAGDDPLVRNNRIAYLAGVDKDLPFGTLNVNLQVVGTVILGTSGLKAGDIEYDEDETYTTTIVNAGITERLLHDTLTIELAGAYVVEDGDYMIRPRLEYNVADDLFLTASSTWFGGDEEGYFGQFNGNSFFQLGARMAF